MKKYAILVAACAALFVLGPAQTAQAQTGVGVYVGPDGFGVTINSGRHGHHHHGNGQWRNRGCHQHGPSCGGHGPVYRQPYPGPDYRYPRPPQRYAPAPITVTVWEYRQVQTPYGWQSVRVSRVVVAYWSHHFNAYVYTDLYGRQRVVDGYRRGW